MSDTEGKTTAPWSPAEVDALNRFQHYGFVHEFTCPDAHDGANRALVATKDGWICPHCDYKQDWAHKVMLQPLTNTVAEMLVGLRRETLRVNLLRWAPGVSHAQIDELADKLGLKVKS